MPFVPIEIICDVMGERYGIPPWEIEKIPYDEAYRYWELYQIRSRVERELMERNRGR